MPEFHLSIPIDHVGLVTSDLDRLEKSYRRLGFRIAPRQTLQTSTRVDQAPQDVGQQSAHIILPQGYLELTAIQGSVANMHLTPYLGRPDGVQIVAIQADSAYDCHQQMERIGLTPSALATSSRPIGYGSGGEACFQWFMLSPDEFPEALMCWVQHLTPDLVYQPEMMHHANGARKLLEVLMIVENFGASQPRYAQLSMPSDPSQETMMPSLTLLSIDEVERRFPGIRPRAKSGVAGLILEVADLVNTIDILNQHGVRVHGDAKREIWVMPEAAGGVLLSFRSVPQSTPA